MKLLDVLKLTDDFVRIILWDKESAAEDAEPLFDGYASDISWQMALCPLNKCLNEGYTAIDVRTAENGDSIMVVGIDYYNFLDNMRNDENENV